MSTSKTSENQAIPLEEPLVGINTKMAPYPAARSWSGGRRRILGKGPLKSYTYHVMSRENDVRENDVRLQLSDKQLNPSSSSLSCSARAFGGGVWAGCRCELRGG
jgi:hypothetical protein